MINYVRPLVNSNALPPGRFIWLRGWWKQKHIPFPSLHERRYINSDYMM